MPVFLNLPGEMLPSQARGPSNITGGPGVLDYAKQAVGETLGLGAQHAALAQSAAAQTGATDGFEFARRVNMLLNNARDRVLDARSVEAKNAEANPADQFIGSTLLSVAGMTPMLAETLGAAVAGPTGMAAAGAVQQAGLVTDQALAAINRLSDEDLQKLPLYADLRKKMPESEARVELANKQVGIAQLARSGALGALGNVVIGRLLTGGTGARFIKGAFLGAAEGAAVTGTLGAQADYEAQQSDNAIADKPKEISWDRVVDTFLHAAKTGGVVGGVLGGYHGAVQPRAPFPAGKERPQGAEHPVAPIETVGENAPDAAQAAAIKAAAADADLADITLNGDGKSVISEPAPQQEPSPALSPAERALTDLDAIAVAREGESAAAGVSDAGQTQPEAAQTLLQQQRDLADPDNPRKAMLFPEVNGKVKQLPLPEGMKRAKIEGAGVVHYDPTAYVRKDIVDAAKQGRLNELLDLGPVTKDEAMARAADGEQPVAVTERTPEGVEVKAAAGTDATAPAQRAALEAAKGDGNTVQVEAPQAVIAGRMEAAPAPEGVGMVPDATPGQDNAGVTLTGKPNREPRVLVARKTPEEARALAEMKQAAARDAAEALRRAEEREQQARDGAEPVGAGRKRGEAEKQERRENNEKADALVEEFMPGEIEQQYTTRATPKSIKARAAIMARAKAMLEAARERGVKIPGSIKDNTDAGMNHSGGVLILSEAKALVGRQESKKPILSEHYERFVRREFDARSGAYDEAVRERREEGDRLKRRSRDADEGASRYDNAVRHDAEDAPAGRQAEDGALADTADGEARVIDAIDAKRRGAAEQKPEPEATKPETAKQKPEPEATGEPIYVAGKDRAGTFKVEKRRPKMRRLGEDGGYTPLSLLDLEGIRAKSTRLLKDTLSERGLGQTVGARIARVFGAKIRALVGETKVHVIRDADMDRLDKRASGMIVEDGAGGQMILIRASVADNPAAFAHTVLHEGVHAAVSHVVEANPYHARTLEMMMREVANHLEEPVGRQAVTYGLTDIHEFIAEALSNPKFQERLAQITVSKKLAARLQLKLYVSLREALVTAIRKMLRIPASEHNMLEAVVRIGDKLIAEARLREGAPKVHTKDRALYLGTERLDNARQAAFKWALDMDAQGASPTSIHLATGFFRGPYDGAWRYEIADNQVRMRPFGQLVESKSFTNSIEYRLGDVLDHPELYKAYPAARDIVVTKKSALMDWAETTQGWFDPATNTINITPYAMNPKSTLLHEIQHWVQHREGFATGGNASKAAAALTPEQKTRVAEKVIARVMKEAEAAAAKVIDAKRLVRLPEFKAWMAAKRAWKAALDAAAETRIGGDVGLHDAARQKAFELDRAMTRALVAFRQAAFGETRYSRLTSEQLGLEIDLERGELTKDGGIDAYIRRLEDNYAALTKELTKLQAGDWSAVEKAMQGGSEAHELYRAIAGEIEARDTQSRMDMGATERALTAPLTSERFDPRDVIVTYGDGTTRSMSEAPLTEAPVTGRGNLDAAKRELVERGQDTASAFARRLRKVQHATDTLTMLAQRAAKHGVEFGKAARDVAMLAQRMDVERQNILNRKGGGLEIVRDAAVLVRRHGAEKFNKLTDLMFDASENNLNLARKGEVANNEHLGKDTTRGAQPKARFDKLDAEFKAMPADMQDWALKVVRFARDERNARIESTINRILEAADIHDKGLAQRIFDGKMTDADRKQFKSNDIVKHLDRVAGMKRIEGWYVPFMRDGDYVVAGKIPFDIPKGAHVSLVPGTDNVVQFVDPNKKGADAPVRRAALAFAASHERLHTGTRKVYVDVNNPAIELEASDTNAVPAYRITLQNEHFSTYDTEAAARRAMAALEEQGLTGLYVDSLRDRKDFKVAGHQPMQYENLLRSLQKRDSFRGMTPAAQNELVQAMREAAIRAMPGARIQKLDLHRRNVEGYSRDLVQSLDRYAMMSANFLAKQRFQPLIDAALKRMAALIDTRRGNDAPRRRELLNELEGRIYGDKSGLPEPKSLTAAASRRLLQVSFLDKLGGVSFHMINSVEPWTTALPVIGGRHGFAVATKALKRAYSLIGGGGAARAGVADMVRAFGADVGFTNYRQMFKEHIAQMADGARAQRLGELLDYLHNTNLFGQEAGMELNRLANPAGTLLGRGIDRADLMARQVGQAVEAINRAASGIAAYELEFARTGDHQKALDYAHDVVHDTMGNYAASNAAPMFNHPVFRLALQFKKFAQKTYYLVGKLASKSLAGDREAQRQFAGLMFTHAMVAGALGLPLEPIKVAMLAANALGATDYTYQDFEELVRSGLANMLGKKGGEIASHGLGRAIGVDISTRMSLAELLTFSQPNSAKAADLKVWLFDTMAGAPIGLVLDQVRGMQAFMGGDYTKAAELMVPIKAVTDIHKAAAGLSAPKKDRHGNPVMEPYSAYEAGLQAIGLTPSRKTEVTEMRANVGRAQQRYKQQRQQLMDRWISGDASERRRVMVDIQRFNAKLPRGARLTVGQLRNAAKNREAQRTSGAISKGMYFNRRDAHLKERQAIYNTDE